MTVSIVSFDMQVVKTSLDPNSGERRIRLSASDTGKDCFGEQMSLELFRNFVRRIEAGVPEVFKSVLKEKSGWEGGMPYTSISHIKSGVNGANIPADILKVYMDGEILKSVAVAKTTPLGDALWNALLKDKDGTSEYPEKIRVSIGFLDLKHSHGDFVFTRDTLEKRCPMCDNGVGDITYLDGVLVHEAFTRKPANPRTDVEVERMAKDIKTKQDDAESIVGPDLAAELEVNKTSISVDELELVEKAAPVDMVDDEEDTEDHPADCVCKACGAKKKKSELEVVAPVVVPAPVERSEMDLAYDELKFSIEQNKSLPMEEALRQVQPKFDALGQLIQKSFVQPVPAPVVDAQAISEAQLEKMAEMFKSVLETALEKQRGELQSLSTEVAVLKSQLSVRPVASPTTVPAPRSMQVERATLRTSAPADPSKPMSIMDIVNSTTKL